MSPYHYDYEFARKNPGYHKGWTDGKRTTDDQTHNHRVRQTLLAPINRKASIKDMRAHPLGYYNVQAIHMRSMAHNHAKPYTSFKQDARLTFDKTGGHEDDGTGIAIFEIAAWPYREPTITGLYQFDPDEPTRSVPVLKMFTVDIGHHNSPATRTLAARFAQANGLSLWWHKDRHLGEHLLLPSDEAQKWWYSSSYYATNQDPAMRKKYREGQSLKEKYKYGTRFYRAINKLDFEQPCQKHPHHKARTATFVFDPTAGQWR